MFGFTVYESIRQASRNGEITYPCPGERVLGGHAIVAAGYDDEKKIKNADCRTETKGALLIRNSWAINGETGVMVGSPMSTCLKHWQGISGYFYVKNGLIPGSLDDSTQVQVLGIFVYSRLFVFEGRESVEYDR